MAGNDLQRIIANSPTFDQLPEGMNILDGDYILIGSIQQGKLIKVKKENVRFDTSSFGIYPTVNDFPNTGSENRLYLSEIATVEGKQEKNVLYRWKETISDYVIVGSSSDSGVQFVDTFDDLTQGEIGILYLDLGDLVFYYWDGANFQPFERNITAEQIALALQYTPANRSTLSSILINDLSLDYVYYVTGVATDYSDLRELIGINDYNVYLIKKTDNTYAFATRKDHNVLNQIVSIRLFDDNGQTVTRSYAAFKDIQEGTLLPYSQGDDLDGDIQIYEPEFGTDYMYMNEASSGDIGLFFIREINPDQVPQHVKDITENDITNWNDAFDSKAVSISVTGDVNKTITFTRQDGSTLTASFNDNNDGTGTTIDDVVNSLEFNLNNDGVLQATTREGTPISVSLDGRYSLLGHTHSADQISESDTRKWVSPTEKNTWNAKVSQLLDNLTSTSTTAGLTANQGRVLKGFIDDINTLLNSDDTTLDELQEIVNYIKQNKSDLENLSISNIAGLQSALNGKEPTFSKNTAFNKNFGTTSGTVAEGSALSSKANDSEVVKQINKSDGTALSKVNGIVTLPEDIPANREVKIVSSSSYSFVAEDFKRKFLVFTNGGNVNAIISGNTDASGEVQGLTIGNTIVNISSNSGSINVTPTEGYLPKTKGDRSRFGMRMHTVNNYSLFGDLQPVSGDISERVEKLIPNTTQYTILASDVDKLLKFTANGGEEIQLIYNANTLPDNNKSIVAMSTGDNILIPTAGTGTVNFGVPAGSLLRTTGINSLVTLQPKTSVNDLAVWGTLEGDIDEGNYESRPQVDINNPYTFVPEDQGKTLIFYNQATLYIPDGLENENITKPIKGINASPENTGKEFLEIGAASGAGLVIPKGYLPKVKVSGTFELNLWYNTMFLTGDLVQEYQVRQSPDGTLWKVSVDNSGNEVITAL
ncbi:hypothetical protein [Salinimicrobium sp. GXAS 041]|uniref:hypothetical protein n=1 Tax=Salinimicrobium sp. GXAS 041 TaxID=3400806 RepID=UPI003C714FED